MLDWATLTWPEPGIFSRSVYKVCKHRFLDIKLPFGTCNIVKAPVAQWTSALDFYHVIVAIQRLWVRVPPGVFTFFVLSPFQAFYILKFPAKRLRADRFNPFGKRRKRDFENSFLQRQPSWKYILNKNQIMFKQMVTENSRRKKGLAHEGPLNKTSCALC